MKDLGLTVLLVEQNAIATLQIADRAYVMETGEIILEGDAADLMHNPEVKRAYLGKGANQAVLAMSIFDRRYEPMSRAELEQLQLERLQALLARLRRNVRRYREKLADLRRRIAGRPARGCRSRRRRTWWRVSPTACLPSRCARSSACTPPSGPEGKPLVIGHTRNDLAQWGRLVARQLVASGVTANDVIQISLGGGVSLRRRRATCSAPNSSRPRSSPKTRSTWITSSRCCRTTGPPS